MASLNALKTATGAATASLSACAGTTTGPIKMSDFIVSSVSGMSCPTDMPPGDIGQAQLTFAGAGSRFISRIGGRATNFNWVSSNETFLIIGGSYGYLCDLETVDIGTVYVRGKLVDGFNTAATNCNTQISSLVNVSEK